MAGGTLGFAMRTDQLVTGDFLVVETDVGPAAAGVAGVAVLAEMTVVMVVFDMA